MLQGLMTVEQLIAETGARNRSGRVRFKVPLIKALEAAHQTQRGRPDYFRVLMTLDKACLDWLARHRSASFRRRRAAVQRLHGQVIALIRPLLAAREQADARLTERRRSHAKTRGLQNLARQEMLAQQRGPGEENDPRLKKARAAFNLEVIGRTIEQATALGESETDHEHLNVQQVGFLAAKAALKVDSVLDQQNREKCRVEAMRVLCAMLGKNRALATTFLTKGVKVVVVPADVPMTSLAEFASLDGVAIDQAADPNGRMWNETRGVGGLVVDDTVYVAVTEENLLGTLVTGAALAAGGGCYATHYSTTAHEFAHVLHQQVLPAFPVRDPDHPGQPPTLVDKSQVVTRAFRRATGGVTIRTYNGTKYLQVPASQSTGSYALTNFLKKVFEREFVDGPRSRLGGAPTEYRVTKEGSPGWVKAHGGLTDYIFTSPVELQDCYAAYDEREYFAQCVCCYLGCNAGFDPYTHRPRHNDRTWLRVNEEPELLALLDELFSAGSGRYGMSSVQGTNEESVTLGPTIQDVMATNSAIGELMGIDL